MLWKKKINAHIYLCYSLFFWKSWRVDFLFQILINEFVYQKYIIELLILVVLRRAKNMDCIYVGSNFVIELNRCFNLYKETGGMQIPTTCCICSTHLEIRDHLFLSCPYPLIFCALVRQGMRTTVPVFTIGLSSRALDFWKSQAQDKKNGGKQIMCMIGFEPSLTRSHSRQPTTKP